MMSLLELLASDQEAGREKSLTLPLLQSEQGLLKELLDLNYVYLSQRNEEVEGSKLLQYPITPALVSRFNDKLFELEDSHSSGCLGYFFSLLIQICYYKGFNDFEFGAINFNDFGKSLKGRENDKIRINAEKIVGNGIFSKAKNCHVTARATEGDYLLDHAHNCSLVAQKIKGNSTLGYGEHCSLIAKIIEGKGTLGSALDSFLFAKKIVAKDTGQMAKKCLFLIEELKAIPFHDTFWGAERCVAEIQNYLSPPLGAFYPYFGSSMCPMQDCGIYSPNMKVLKRIQNEPYSNRNYDTFYNTSLMGECKEDLEGLLDGKFTGSSFQDDWQGIIKDAAVLEKCFTQFNLFKPPSLKDGGKMESYFLATQEFLKSEFKSEFANRNILPSMIYNFQKTLGGKELSKAEQACFGVFLSAMIQTSYDQGYNNFKFDKINCPWFGTMLQGREEDPINIEAGEIVGSHAFCFSKNCNLKTNNLESNLAFGAATNCTIETDSYNGTNFGDKMMGCAVYSAKKGVLKTLQKQAPQTRNIFEIILKK